MKIDFNFINETKENVLFYKKEFKNIFSYILNSLSIREDVSISIIIVNDDKIRKLNKEYRDIDKVTDVLSFYVEEKELNFYKENNLPREMGDIFINYDRAILQASEYEHSLQREMCFLFVHGCLHLLGYDHHTKEEEKEMFSLQDKILRELNINR